MVARLLWEQDAAGSSPVTSTIFQELKLILSSFSFTKNNPKLLPMITSFGLFFAGGDVGNRTAQFTLCVHCRAIAL